MRIRLAGTRRGWKKMLPPIERGRLNEQVLIAPVLRTPAPSWPPGINRCGKQRGQYRGQILSAKLMTGSVTITIYRSNILSNTLAGQYLRVHRLVEGESPQSPRLTAPVTTFYYRRPTCRPRLSRVRLVRYGPDRLR